ncbi:autoinducer binding domain-containing protein [Ramlibacter sp.]|uniref:autoinducer binding domain-containing protein n=1 Tax=Ramlibacter sp. TaxID=1917967 RepID=UPI0018242434|nr:autoinducer binding domain-containing protein [Ramlibacter sp.]MBA2674458.1 autoinducer binding domain-containing protein [Ramlibacter sp.]
MKSWQVSQLRQISSAGSSEETFSVVLAEAQKIGFEYCSFGMKAPIPLAAPRATWCSNYPIAWQQLYDERGYIRRDPSVAHALVSDDAILWTDALFAPCREIRTEAAAHGLAHGWAQPRRDARGMVSLLTLARKDPPISAQEVLDKTERLKWLSFVCHEGMLKSWGDLLQEDMGAALSARETEVLRWSCDGKTAEDIAQILGLSEATVSFHVRNACLKLGTSNKTAAAVRAALMGLLW